MEELNGSLGESTLATFYQGSDPELVSFLYLRGMSESRSES
jgi:hypothetical protein